MIDREILSSALRPLNSIPAEGSDGKFDEDDAQLNDDNDQEGEDEQDDQYTSGERASEELTEIDESRGTPA